jgi:hypothetical protein
VPSGNVLCSDGAGVGLDNAQASAALPQAGHEAGGVPAAGRGRAAAAQDAAEAFDATYGARFPKAAAKITDDLDQLLAFYDYPAEHWVHLRTTNPIESASATVRHRTKVTKGPRLARGGPGHGVQADRVSPGPLAHGQRTAIRRPGPRRSDLHQRQDRRTTRRGRSPRSRLKDLESQVLTIAHSTRRSGLFAAVARRLNQLRRGRDRYW